MNVIEMPPWRIITLPTVTSTNTYARTLFEQGNGEGLVIRAILQTCGRGRLSRTWASPNGGLWFSFLVEPSSMNHYWGLLPIITGIAVLESLQDVVVGRLAIKWPNDVLLDQRKIAGILCQNVAQEKRSGIIIGVGINSNFTQKSLPAELQNTATSVLENHSSLISNDSLLQQFLDRFSSLYNLFQKREYQLIIQKWKEHASLLNHTVTISTDTQEIIGLVHGLDETGAILLQINNRITPIYAGDVQSGIRPLFSDLKKKQY